MKHGDVNILNFEIPPEHAFAFSKGDAVEGYMTSIMIEHITFSDVLRVCDFNSYVN